MKRIRNRLKDHIGDRKVGLALGSGSAKGLSHIGVLKALEELEIKIDYVAGTSIGSLIGGAYAAGLPLDKIEDIALETDVASMAKFFMPTIPKFGLVTGLKVENFFQSHFGEREIESLIIPYAAVATDILTGEEVVFYKGSLVKAIRASISIPVIFKPVIHNDLVLVDGGLTNPLPIDIVRKMGAEFIIAVNVIKPLGKNKDGRTDNRISRNVKALSSISPFLQSKLEEFHLDSKWIMNVLNREEKHEIPGIKKIFNQSVQITQQKLAGMSIKLYKPDILIEPDTSFVGFFDFHKAKEIINVGYKFALKSLKI